MRKTEKKIASQYVFHGTTTIGERGQAVIPSGARKNFSLKKGEKLLVFGLGKEMLALVKFDQVKELAKHLEKKLELVQQALHSIK